MGYEEKLHILLWQTALMCWGDIIKGNYVLPQNTFFFVDNTTFDSVNLKNKVARKKKKHNNKGASFFTSRVSLGITEDLQFGTCKLW